MKKLFIPLFILMAAITVTGQTPSIPNIVQDHKITNGYFYLASDDFVADILIDENDHKTVKLAAQLFCDDIERITDQTPDIKNDISSLSRNGVIIGSIENSNIIQKLIRNDKIDVQEIENQWESCLIQVVDQPFKGMEKGLVIAGSDRRGTAYGLLELSKQMGVSPWYYFADVPPKKKNAVYLKEGRYIQGSPSVKYRGIFINDEMWGLRPWAMHTLAPEEGKGLGPTTYAKIFELLLRLKANCLWPAMHQQTIPFNIYERNSVVADKYGIVMGSSHIEPMLRNNIAGAEWDREYPGEPWDYTKNRDHIYEYWEERIKENGQYENIYTIGKRGKDDVAGSDINVPVLEEIFADQRSILKKHIDKDISEIPQMLVAYTEILDLYNKGLEVPKDVIICWPDDNFGNIRQLPDKQERNRPGGSGVYYHFQWINGATSAYPWLHTTPPALTWLEMKKAYDYNVREFWIVNVGDIKPAEVGIEHFMQMAWDISDFEENDPRKFFLNWATRDFGSQYAPVIADIMEKHFELGYARRPDHMVMYNGREKEIKWDWFSTSNYNDEAQRRVDQYDRLIDKVDSVYNMLPTHLKDAFYQMVLYNVKCAGLHNKKVIYAQKSNAYGQQNRASAARYASMAQQAEDEINQIIHHYNKNLITVGDKWDRMASLPGPWGGQWHQWDMPPLSSYSGAGYPNLQIDTEGENNNQLPVFNKYSNTKHYVDLFNTGNGVVYWSVETPGDWIKLSESSGKVNDEKRVWIDIDWDKAPTGASVERSLVFNWSSSVINVWKGYEQMSEEEKKAYREGTLSNNNAIQTKISLFNPASPAKADIKGFVETNGYISMEAEHYSRKTDRSDAGWSIIQGLGRTGNSVTVWPSTLESITKADDISSSSPLVEYDFYAFTEGEAELQINCIPSLPINENYGLRIAFALDDNDPQIISRHSSRNVIDNLMTLNSKLNIEQEGNHTLKIWMVDPGVAMDKIIIDAGGLKKSYLGPPETIVK